MTSLDTLVYVPRHTFRSRAVSGVPMLVLLSLAALAGPTGHYHPTELIGQSQQYARASASAGAAFQDVEGKAGRMARALLAYEESLYLLGGRAPEAAWEDFRATKKRFNRQKAVVDAFATTMMEDFDATFGAALERAAATFPGAAQCLTEVPVGRALPGMPRRTEKNPDCTGDDLNGEVAAAMDADPELVAAVDEILALEWPPLDVPAEPMPAVGDGPWIPVSPWFRAAMGPTLTAIDRADERERMRFEAALEQNTSKEDLRALAEEARALTESTGRAKAEAAAPVLKALDRLAKKKQPHAWCVRPEALGGCAGEALGSSEQAALREDRRVERALP